MSRQTVLVTGANGFVGRHVARVFAREGYRVLGIGHGGWLRDEWEQWGLAAWTSADVTLATLREHTEDPSVIVHCAGGGSVAFSIENPIADFMRTVETTAQVLEYVRTVAPQCSVVYPSSASVYGAVDHLPITADQNAAPISQYGVHKLMAELFIASYARQFGTSTAIVRLFSIYGCGLQKQLLWDACRKFAAGDSIFTGTGDEVRDWLHVEDAAELLLAATENASVECPTVNGGSGEGITVREVLTHLKSSFPQRDSKLTFSGLKEQEIPVGT
ncbi:SDR family oxidoreductase [Tunturiibacter empetritectus]|uniref:NAD-dependent epimerase/dehydratase family protein n=1 Tax=Tunturiibacter empetritectus TaxID=3069691 RepID=UPI003D9B2BFD